MTAAAGSTAVVEAPPRLALAAAPDEDPAAAAAHLRFRVGPVTVRWDPGHAFRCTCSVPDARCEHVTEVRRLLGPGLRAHLAELEQAARVVAP